MGYKKFAIRYTCGAFPPEHLQMNRTYILSKDDKGLFYADGDIKYRTNFNEAKLFFTPAEATWDEVVKELK